MQGGAYGCSLGFSQISGITTYSSYRDPNIASTLAAYDATGDHLRRHPPSAAELSKAIIGAIGALDAPQSVNGNGSSSPTSALSLSLAQAQAQAQAKAQAQAQA